MLSSFFIVCCACWWSAAVSWDYPAPSDSSFLSTYEPQVKPNGTLPSDSSFLSGVLSSLTVTAVSEVGDKTFFIALVLALTHPPAIVYAGALSALAFMTILSGFSMSSNAAKEELEEVQKTVETKMTYKGSLDLESGVRKLSTRWVFVESFTMTFISEWGDRSQIATVILAAKHCHRCGAGFDPRTCGLHSGCRSRGQADR
ncbi:unnamed protein product [Larinioides sclopetarius]|uniref:GDT1 family protein n=1 Tax=Larinioides sclopetarius TaxID=280406 RepID=A0AAV2B3M6_9ARAC